MTEKIKKPPLKDRLKERLRLMLSLDYSPHKLALAAALGMLVGISPYVGFQTYIAIGLSTLFRVPLYPLIIGVYITNPLTIPFIYTATTKFGMWILDVDLDFDFDWDTFNLKTLWEAGKTLFLPFVVGTHVIGAALSVFTYPVVYYIVRLYKRK